MTVAYIARPFNSISTIIDKQGDRVVVVDRRLPYIVTEADLKAARKERFETEREEILAGPDNKI